MFLYQGPKGAYDRSPHAFAAEGTSHISIATEPSVEVVSSLPQLRPASSTERAGLSVSARFPNEIRSTSLVAFKPVGKMIILVLGF